MSGYPFVLFDIDHTLFDFEAGKAVAFAAVLREQGIDDPKPLEPIFSAVEQPLWRGLEQGELTLDTLNDARFAGLVERAGLDADPSAMANAYLAWLGRSGGLIDGARRLLDTLAGRCVLGLASNGYSAVQRARIDNFDLAPYFDAVVISDEIGVAKPDTRFFDEAIRQLGNPEPSDVLMVGDSLSSDMEGGRRSGTATCWFNPSAQPAPAEPLDHVVTHLDEVASIVL